ncbi:PIG-L family deacetylase [Nitrospinae bacterium AH_259_B05_G02_I21]|nr:PIG-L family deacetylase [Nitrospinae bacterium AH_259_B05_G02_I21]MDA2931655.1 PIG-L family deacetylase [Nitrospinae bacterium AH-259-F20]
MQWTFKRLLFVGAHLDDIEFGGGGLIAQRQTEASIKLLALSKHTRSAAGEIQIIRDTDEAYQAAKLLGVVSEDVHMENLDGQLFQRQQQEVREVLLSWRAKYDPDVVFCPSIRDIHQDHRVVAEEVCRIFRHQTCLGYECVRSSLDFRPTLYVGISEDALKKKIDAVLAYESQLDERQSAAYYFSGELIRAVALHRGAQVAKELAEAFEVYFLNV